jgi:hypothetical protein
MSSGFNLVANSSCLANVTRLQRQELPDRRNSHNPMNKSAGKDKPDRRQTKMTAN